MIASVDAVADLYRQLLASWNRCDAPAWGERFAEEGILVGFDGSPVDSRAAIVTLLRASRRGGTATAAPHDMQNFARSVFSSPHAGQVATRRSAGAGPRAPARVTPGRRGRAVPPAPPPGPPPRRRRCGRTRR